MPSIEFPDFTNAINETGIGDIGFLGQTAAWGDYNNDGCLDLFVANTDFGLSNVFLFKNNCNGTFSDLTVGSGILDMPLRSASWADFDNDMFLDLIVGTLELSRPPILYKNHNRIVFSDVSDGSVITCEGRTKNHVVWDVYELDGFVDFFQSGLGVSFLYHNQGDGTFMEVTGVSGIASTSSNSAIWFDFNNDGFPDLFLAKSTSNQFYLNNRDNTFTDITDVAGLKGVSNSISGACCSADFNNDGLVDLYVSNVGERNALYRNNGDGTFSDVTFTSGTGDVGDSRTCAWVDIDAEGFIDILTTNHTADTKVF
ncbi:MAG: FG-GAP repeat domain-containing protein, partial [Thermodesulfobacteriota bacterium]